MGDIMADNATEAVLSVLDRGEADNATRDKVSAALLRQVGKMSEAQEEMKRSQDELKLMITALQQNMMSSDNVKHLAAEVHDKRCAECPAKKWADKFAEKPATHDADKSKQHWFSSLLSSESFRYFILMLVLVWAVVYIKGGSAAVESVKSGLTHTATGGLK